MNRPCRKCKSEAFRTEQVVFKNGTEHIARYCLECDAFLDYAAKEMPAGMFVMPFGKYRGMNIAKLVETDKDYCDWLIREKPNSSIAERIRQVRQENSELTPIGDVVKEIMIGLLTKKKLT